MEACLPAWLRAACSRSACCARAAPCLPCPPASTPNQLAAHRLPLPGQAIVDSILVLIRDIPEAKEMGLAQLCEFIEVGRGAGRGPDGMLNGAARLAMRDTCVYLLLPLPCCLHVARQNAILHGASATSYTIASDHNSMAWPTSLTSPGLRVHLPERADPAPAGRGGAHYQGPRWVGNRAGRVGWEGRDGWAAVHSLQEGGLLYLDAPRRC